MRDTSRTGTAQLGCRAAFGLLLAVAALSGGTGARGQTLFSTNASPLPALPESQLGTAGTTTITQGAGASTGWSLLGQTAEGVTDAASPARPQNGAAPTSRSATASAADEDDPYVDDLNRPYDQSPDLDDLPIDQREALQTPVDPTGIRLGTFLLRPSVNQSINTENTRNGAGKDIRNYLATGIRGTLSSDWSRHALSITGESTFERNLGGSQTGADPEASLDADLRLDLSDETTAHITGGYSFEQEDASDPNAVGGASDQAGIHQFDGGISVERDLGRIRGLAAVNGTRYLYTDAKLADGTVVDSKDRNRTAVDGRLRLGYELSPALIPFGEVAFGHTFYDRERDSGGYARSSDSYAAKAGLALDLGEKLRGELAAGYERVAYQDSRLDAVNAITVDGTATWSPQRGTDVNMGLRTTVQDSTVAGESGWVEYQMTSAVAHRMRDNLVGRLTGSTTFRDFDGASDNDVTWIAGAGLTWNINRYLDMTGDVEYEKTTGGASEEEILRAGVGLTLRR